MKDCGSYKISFSRLWQEIRLHIKFYTKEEGGTTKGSDFRESDQLVVFKAPT